MSDEEVKSKDGEDLEGMPDALSELNNMTSKGVIQDLLGPSAKIIGNYWGEKTKHAIERLRMKNLQSHVDKVTNKQPIKMIDVTPRKASQLERWADNAKDIDADEPEAAIWQAVLDEIMRENTDNILLSAAEELNAKDLESLEALSRDKDSRLIYGNFRKLETLGLVRGETLATRALTVAAGFLLFGIATVIVNEVLKNYFEITNDQSSFFNEPTNTITVIGMLLVLVGVSAGLKCIMENSLVETVFSLTETGSQLIKKISKYRV
ncbi:MAG: hypothetical protein ABJN69_01050 [Hellea sp.]